MYKESSKLINFLHNNARALGSMGYFIILMLVFLIGAPEAWMRPNLHQSVFVMMPTLLFLVIPLVFLVASGEIDLSFASTYALAAYVFAWLIKAGIDPALAILAGVISGGIVGALVGALIVVFQPEIRKFLLMIGSTNLSRKGSLISRFKFLNGSINKNNIDANSIIRASNKMASSKTGALMVLERNNNLDFLILYLGRLLTL